MRSLFMLPLALLLSLPHTFAAAADDITQYLPAGAHAIRAAPPSEALTDAISRRSDALFDVIFDRCVAGDLPGMITADFEFHHDQWGTIADSRDRFVDKIHGNCLRRASGEDPVVRRERVPGTLTVYPIGDDGALETGVHRFHEIAKDGRLTLVGIARYSHLWKREDGEWRVSRIFSYDHMDVR